MPINSKCAIKSPYSDKALPGHMKTDYWECYAKYVLSYIDSDTYGRLILSDKPDLVDKHKSLGVEVTRAGDEKSFEASSLYSQNLEECDESKRLKRKKQIELCGGTLVNDGIMIGPDGKDSFKLILDGLDKKLKRLNSGEYQTMENYHLFVMSDILASEEMLNEALSRMIEVSESYDVVYGQIIVSVPQHNYVFNLCEKTWSDNLFPLNEQHPLAFLARGKVFELEKVSFAGSLVGEMRNAR